LWDVFTLLRHDERVLAVIVCSPASYNAIDPLGLARQSKRVKKLPQSDIEVIVGEIKLPNEGLEQLF